MTNEDVVERGLKLFREKEAEGDIFLIDFISTRISVLSGKVEKLEERRYRGCGIRVFFENRIGFSFTSELSERSLSNTVRKALDFSRLSSKDDSNVLPAPLPAEPIVAFNPALRSVSTPRKIDFALRIEESALNADPRIEKIKEANYRDFIGDVYVANSRGINLKYTAGRATGSAELSATDGTSPQLGYHQAFGSTIDDMNPHAIGKTAAEKAIVKLGSREFKTAKTVIVLSNEISSSIFAETFPFFSAKKVIKNKSVLGDKLGKKVASQAVTLIDDGRKKEGFSTQPFDSEGTPSQETFLIRNGILESYLHNYQTACKMKMKPTSNSVRGSYENSPRIGITNLYFKPSDVSSNEIIRSIKSGIYISDILGLHTADTITGDFSFGASGRYIENGNLSYPVHRIAISGNLLTLLESVEAVADDLEFFTWGGGVTMLIREMVVSGT